MAKKIKRATRLPPRYQIYCAFSPLNSMDLLMPLLMWYTLLLILFLVFFTQENSYKKSSKRLLWWGKRGRTTLIFRLILKELWLVNSCLGYSSSMDYWLMLDKKTYSPRRQIVLNLFRISSNLPLFFIRKNTLGKLSALR